MSTFCYYLNNTRLKVYSMSMITGHNLCNNQCLMSTRLGELSKTITMVGDRVSATRPRQYRGKRCR